MMGDWRRYHDEILDRVFARVIVDEGHKMKGGNLFDRSVSIVKLQDTYKQIHTATLISNRITDYSRFRRPTE